MTPLPPEHLEAVAAACRRAGWGTRLLAHLGAAAPSAPPAEAPYRPCRHEGPVVEAAPCGSPWRHVRHCLFDGHDADRCTRGPSRIQSCGGCDHYAPPTPTGRRHLLYHVYPVAGNGAWRWNVGQLCRRLGLFDGRAVVAVVTDRGPRRPDPGGPHGPKGRRADLSRCDSFDDVRRAFGPHAERVEFLDLDNDPGLREVRSLVPLLERVADAGPDDAVLYAQAKGTTYPVEAQTIRRWAEVMYEVYLDYWPAVAAQLAGRPVTGAFKKLGAGWLPHQSKSDWHYSGSWFWVRAADLFARDWRRADRFWSGIESWPSQQFLAAEAGCLFHEGQVPRMNLYASDYWRAAVEPALARWKQDHAAERADW